MEKLPIRLRPATADDVPFIFNAWLKSYRNSLFATGVANEIFYTEHHKIIENLLKKYDVVIACSEEDSSQIFGFICAGPTDNIFTLNYIYVKHPFRKMGIANAMLNSFEHNTDFVGIYTHQSKCARSLAQKYNFIYHPYIALNPDAYLKKSK